MYVLHIVYKIRENVLQFMSQKIKAIVVRKITNFTFCREKEQIVHKIYLKSKEPNIDYGMPLTTSLQSLIVDPIIILFVSFVRNSKVILNCFY